MMDFKVFVHSDDDIRLLRRLKRDVIHRGRTIEGVLKAYNRFVKSAYDEYIKPVRPPSAYKMWGIDDEVQRHHSAQRRRESDRDRLHH